MDRESKSNCKDTILDEVHAIQKKHYKERKNLTWEQEKELINNNVSKFESKYGIRFKVVSPKDLFVLSK